LVSEEADIDDKTPFATSENAFSVTVAPAQASATPMLGVARAP
jgi:hypothetical protein